MRKSASLTFNEKVRYRMLADRRSVLTTFADKFAVRGYVESRVGAKYLPTLYAVTSEPRTLLRDKLPREFVVKPTRGSGACVIVAEFASSETMLPDPPALPPPAWRRRLLRTRWPNAGWLSTVVHPDTLDWDRLRRLCRHWLSVHYGGLDAWAYENVVQQILVEELLDGHGVPLDFKFFVFDGHVRMIQVDLDRFTGHTRTLYTPRWERLPVAYEHPMGIDVERPDALAEMVEVAERLGGEMDFVRVDLYCVGDRIVFGELTPYPVAGRGVFAPPEFDRQLGEWWALPELG